MNASEILERIDRGYGATSEEMGWLLPELERRKQIVAYKPQRHHSRRFSCLYEWRGHRFVWVRGGRATEQDGAVARQPDLAIWLDHPSQRAGVITTTQCRQCGVGIILILDGDSQIRVNYAQAQVTRGGTITGD